MNDTLTTTTTTSPRSPLREIRRARELSQERLAALAGLSRGWVGYVERCPEVMTSAAAAKLAAVLGVQPADLRLGAAAAGAEAAHAADPE